MASVRPQPSSAPRTSLIDALVVAMGLFLATLTLFSRAGGNGFVNYDDPDYVTANPHVQAGLSAAGIRWAITAHAASNWHPLTWLSHMLDVSLFGLSPAGHHATSVFLHALNAAVIFLALRRLTRAFWTSALAAALFAFHPLRVESVAWVAERKDVLSGLFFFVCLWAYAGFAEQRRRGTPAFGWYAVLLVAFVLGLLSKPMVVTLPFVLLLLDYWPLQRWSGSAKGTLPALGGLTDAAPPVTAAGLVREKVPLFLLAAGSCAVTYIVQKQGGAVTAALSLGLRLANAVIAIPRYLGLIFWPSNLAVLYPHPGRWPLGLVVVAALLTVALTALAWAQRRRRPWLIVGWLWFLGMLVPVIGVVQVGLQSIADRYTYLPVIGLQIAVVWTAREWLGGGANPQPAALVPSRRGNVCGPLALAALGALAALTVAHIGVWKNSLTLFNHTIAVAGAGNYLAYDNRGIAWGELGETDKAVADYEHALAINPAYPNANNNLARALADRGQLDAAIAHYRTALAASPGMLEVHNNLANALSDAGRIDEAIEHYQYVLQRDPNHVNALNGYAVALASKGNLTAAEREFRHVLQLDPANVSALSNLGNVYALLGRTDDAERLFSQALEQHPDDPRTLYNLANVLTAKGRLTEAAENYTRAVQLAPVNPDAHAALGSVLLRLGRPQEAIPQLQLALQQRPKFPQAQAWLQSAEAAVKR